MKYTVQDTFNQAKGYVSSNIQYLSKMNFEEIAIPCNSDVFSLL